MPAWTETDDAQALIGGSFSTAETNALGGILSAAEGLVTAYLGGDPSEGGSVTKYFTGDGSDRLNLGPDVTSVTSVWEDQAGYFGVPSDSFHATETLLTAGTEYVLENEGGKISGVLVRIGGVWPYTYTRRPTRLSSELDSCLGCVKVTFVKRVGPKPPIVTATYFWAAHLWSGRVNGTGTINSESLDGASYSVTPFGTVGEGYPIPPMVKQLLDPFRRHAIARM